VNLERGPSLASEGGTPAHQRQRRSLQSSWAPVMAHGTPTYESTCKARYLRRSRSAPRPASRSRLVPKPGSRFPSVTAGFALRPYTGRTGGILPSGRSQRTPAPVPSLPHGRPCAAGGRGLGCRSAGLRGVQNQRPTACRSQPRRPERAGTTPTCEIQWRGGRLKVPALELDEPLRDLHRAKCQRPSVCSPAAAIEPPRRRTSFSPLMAIGSPRLGGESESGGIADSTQKPAWRAGGECWALEDTLWRGLRAMRLLAGAPSMRGGHRGR
jgi:hypothetical protein